MDLLPMGPFMEHLGLEVTDVADDRLVAEWNASEKHHQPYGIVHGGVHASVVETLGSIASALWYGEQGKCVGVSNHTDFYRAVSQGRLTSVATPVHRGRQQQVWRVETRDDEDRLVASGQLRVQNLPHR
jgi:uncharacterized protein (TIGR00369 family)